MKAFVSTNNRFLVDTAGRLWTPSNACAYDFWTRYLDVFDEVRVVARARPGDTVPESWHQATGSRVTAVPVPDFHTPLEWLRDRKMVRRIVHAEARDAPALIFRVPCLIGATAQRRECRHGRPYGVEVIGDPYDALAPGAFKNPLRPFYRWSISRMLRRLCVGACAASYVTAETLQRRYPPAADAHATHFSSIRLPDEALADRPRRYEQPDGPLRLITVGTLATLYKAPHVLIDAVGRCVARGVNVELTLVGDGKHRGELEQRAHAPGLNGRVRFLGHLASSVEVRHQLDQADVFVLPSFQEGLPRAMIEAMARGLPCIGSTAGGIPELLEADEMVPPGDAEALAGKIREVAASPQRLGKMSARNLQKADAYRDAVLRQRRIAFYEHIRDRTAEWLKQDS